MTGIKILKGDNRRTLARYPVGRIQTVVTSPPFWSVRDYNTPPVKFPRMKFVPAVGLKPIRVPAWEGQLGLEPDPWHFIGHLLLSFRAVWRVLRDDGTLFVDMGDTYFTGEAMGQSRVREAGTMKRHQAPNRVPLAGYKPKDLMGIPWMLAKAMQAEGWTLRAENIWHKPNVMPESASDRTTRAHEHVFHFSKGENYFYDAEAIREPVTGTAHHRGSGANPKARVPGNWDVGPGNHHGNGRFYKQNASFSNAVTKTVDSRNRRSVMAIASKAYRGEHCATFPPDLVRPFLMAGASAKGRCPDCWAPWHRFTTVIDVAGDGADLLGEALPASTKTTTGWRPSCVCGSPGELDMRPDDLQEFETPTGDQLGDDLSMTEGRRGIGRETVGSGKRLITHYEQRQYADQLRKLADERPLVLANMREQAANQGTGGPRTFEHYSRTDVHGRRPIPPELLDLWISRDWLQRVVVPAWRYPDPLPCCVADPFAGSGTTGEVARELGLDAVLCELAAHYLPEIQQRTGNATPGLALA